MISPERTHQPERLVVTVDGTKESLLNEFTDDFARVLLFAGRQIERAILEESEQLYAQVLHHLPHLEISRSEALTAICGELSALLGFGSCSIFLHDSKHAYLTLAASSEPITNSDAESVRIPTTSPITGRALQNRSIVIAEEGVDDNCLEDPSHSGKHLLQNTRVQVIAAPILEFHNSDPAQPLGVLYLRTKQSSSSTDESGMPLYPLHTLDFLRAHRTAEVLLPAIKLATAMRVHQQAMSTTRHDQKVPAFMIAQFADYLAGKSADWHAHNYSFVKHRLGLFHGFASLILVLHDLSKYALEGRATPSPNFEPNVRIRSDVVSPILEGLGFCYEKYDLQHNPFEGWSQSDDAYSFQHIPPLYADERMLTVAFYNLIDNAMKYSTRDPTIRVNAFHDRDTCEYAIRIQNYGGEISLNEAEDIFLPFVRGASSQGVEGMGYGLSFARSIMSSHDGRLIATQLNNPVRFEMRLPDYLSKKRPVSA
ncbi:MAG: GAF domain-containing protein [Phycisphaeraceae bacterium]|nr:GAF domain-containing protein [Phycisphaerales bacterium]MCB9842481.1 GAF domain-containing protein [Phycisphaeraceae bacterium]